jgi:hypothetical protein
MFSGTQGKALLIVTVLLVTSVLGGYYLYNETKIELNTITSSMEALLDEHIYLHTLAESLNSSLKSSNIMIEDLQSEVNELRENNSILMDEYDILEREHSSLLESHDVFVASYHDLNHSFQELNVTFTEFEAEYLELQSRYDELVSLINMTVADDLIQTISFNVTPGATELWEFLIPEYGIVWEARLSFSGVYVSMSHYWRRGGERYFVGSSGMSLTMVGYEEYPYYGPQEFLWGDVTVSWAFDSHDHKYIWVSGSIVTNLPTISRGGSARIEI